MVESEEGRESEPVPSKRRDEGRLGEIEAGREGEPVPSKRRWRLCATA